MPKISVVVPMYNSEKVLSVCVTSILQQTFTDFELILVDDFSTDKTLAVAKNFDDARIKILRTEKNLGYPGAVRNIGLDAAAGDYVFFMDHDDIILPNAFEVLTEIADKTCADAVTTTSWYLCENFESDDMTLQQVKLKSASPVSKDIKTRLWNEIVLSGVHVAPWCWIYRRNFLCDNEIKFPAEVAEDVFFTVDVIFATNKIEKVDFPFYVWRNFKNSASKDISRVYRNMLSVLHLSDRLEEKLAPLDDPAFTSKFIFLQVDGALDSYLAQFFGVDDETVLAALDEVTRALKPRFGKNTLFVRSILQGYLQGRNVINKNAELKKKFANSIEI